MVLLKLAFRKITNSHDSGEECDVEEELVYETLKPEKYIKNEILKGNYNIGVDIDGIVFNLLKDSLSKVESDNYQGSGYCINLSEEFDPHSITWELVSVLRIE
jgi:hypothetical protein